MAGKAVSKQCSKKIVKLVNTIKKYKSQIQLVRVQ